MCVRVRVVVYTSMYVCMYVYIYLCMYICVCMYTRRHLGSSHLRSSKLCSQVRAAGPVFARTGEVCAKMSLMESAATNDAEEEHQIRMATELSRSLQKEPSLVHSQDKAAMPCDFVLKSIPPNGWCFYDCVREHLHLASDGSGTSISTSSIAALCLSCLANLALRSEECREYVADLEETHDRRKDNVFKHWHYLRRSAELENKVLYIYILDIGGSFCKEQAC